jgi:NAD(P)-dependent dehydrogenase (short-subunit alcohol dehydrogenase family)
MESLRVLVTGGSRGIGRAIALRFAREGARVAVAARSSGQLDAVVKEIEAAGGHGRAQQMNVGDHGSVEAAVWRAVEFTGGAIDVLVNNAGAFSVQPFAKLELATWRRHIEVNLDGPFYVTSEALEPLLAGHRPHIFNMSSIAGRRAYPGGVAYSTTKYGLRGFSDALREDLRAQGVRVSTIYPGPTDTGIFDGIPGDWDRTKMNKPEDVAEVIWQAYASPSTSAIDDLEIPPPR